MDGALGGIIRPAVGLSLERGNTGHIHDRAAARASGLSDVFMNILTTNGLVGRFVTDWAGRDARLEGVAIKLGAPNLPGDTMKLSGKVKSKDETKGTVEVEVTGANAWGDHVTGTVTVVLPRRA